MVRVRVRINVRDRVRDRVGSGFDYFRNCAICIAPFALRWIQKDENEWCY